MCTSVWWQLNTNSIHCGSSYRRIGAFEGVDELPSIQSNDASRCSDAENIRKYKHLSLIKRAEHLSSATPVTESAASIDLDQLESILSASDYVSEDEVDVVEIQAQRNNADSFFALLEYVNKLQQRTMTESLATEKARAFWNPLEPMSTRDVTSWWYHGSYKSAIIIKYLHYIPLRVRPMHIS